MKKTLLFITSVLLVLAIAGCHKEKKEEDPMMNMPNPFSELESLKDAVKEVGFDLEIPDSFNGSAKYIYRVMNREMIEVICVDENGNEVARIRKAKGSDDISGDFNDYPDVTMDNSLRNITFKGKDGKYVLAVWQEKDHSYAVSVVEGKTLDEMQELLKLIR